MTLFLASRSAWTGFRRHPTCGIIRRFVSVEPLPNKEDIVNKYRQMFEANPEAYENDVDSMVQDMIREMRGRQKKHFTEEECNDMASKYVDILCQVSYSVSSFRRKHFRSDAAKVLDEHNWFENSATKQHELLEYNRYNEGHEAEKEVYEWIESLDEKTSSTIEHALFGKQPNWEYETYQPSSGGVNMFKLNPDKKATLEIQESELTKVLPTKEALTNFKKIVGSRYSKENSSVKITCQEANSQYKNKILAQLQLAQCIEYSLKITNSKQ